MSFPVEPVVVRLFETVGEDSLNEPVKEGTDTTVDGVLVAPGPRADLTEGRPEGVLVQWTLYFPKTYTGSLEGAQIQVRGEWCRVVGHPDAFDAGWCPTDWNRVVEVEKAHG